jgi:O-antigen/teichoic acid export membrane protein
MATPPQSPGPSLTKQTFWFALAKTISFILTAIVPLLLVRLLNQTELGLYKQAFLVALSAQRILTLGFGLSAFYLFPRMRGEEKPFVANIVFFNLAVGLLAWIGLSAYPPLLQRIFGTPDLVPHASLLGAIVLLWVFSWFLEIAPAAMQETKVSTVMIVTMQVTRMVFMVAAALWSATLTALLWSAIAQGIVQTVVLMRYLNSRFPGFLRSFSRRDFKIQFTYILPLTVAYFIGVLTQDAPQYLVANHFGPALYAVFTVGTVQLPLMSILQDSVGMVLIPAVSRMHHEGRNRDIVLTIAAAMRKTAAIVFPVYAGLLMVSHEFIVFLYTKLYESATPIFIVNLAMLPLMALIYDPLVRTFDEVRKMLVWVRAVLLLLLVLGVWLGARNNSMTAAVYAVVLAALAERLVIGARMTRVLKLSWSDWKLFTDMGKIALASAAGAVVVGLLRLVLLPYGPLAVLLPCGAVFCVVYVAGMVLLKVPSKEEYGMLRRFLPWRAETV